jgi:hypothetical protein
MLEQQGKIWEGAREKVTHNRDSWIMHGLVGPNEGIWVLLRERWGDVGSFIVEKVHGKTHVRRIIKFLRKRSEAKPEAKRPPSQ